MGFLEGPKGILSGIHTMISNRSVEINRILQQLQDQIILNARL